ncbi:MAG: YggS family pyridoxal phosphate-dependent enzyme [Gammaproteobacteria bacterium]|nr:YggS family pyridoxal phosphate-dependent enzyme [Gammaproteobacteria bacterium]MBU2676310.1 YggS family pyridoxal phosphate-dependent enzyme [Gammaproteobacteria bacterium]NNC57973.1 YggS family pyridoxal phosphate-dependent enzyme [Woeseiaceae bacterium]NNL50044.1 YggS family pyridoxal phosphate-dependent enzyme [Woeseiaceae bacterium]
MIRVTENLRKIRDLLAISAIEAERDPETVNLLAVSKKQPLDKILRVASLGQRDFGENIVQEGLEKIRATTEAGLTWHFIGHLQSNKTRAVAENFDWVHTIDKYKTAHRLSQQRPASLGPLNACLQVNIDNEPGKSGCASGEVAELAAACIELPNIRLRGLMCLPRIRHDFDGQRRPFARLRELSRTLANSGIETDTLSMGMTADYRAAIHEGATIVRIGTALFGERT